MEEKKTPYKRVNIEDDITDIQVRQSLSNLDQPWGSRRARFQIARTLAIGLMVLFGLIIICSGTGVISLTVISAFPQMNSGQTTQSYELIMSFVSLTLPYIATPLGVALGYFFKDSSEA